MYRVLIVEDDPQVAQINSDFLEQSGFEIAGVAANEQQAQALLRETQIQMILLDIYLPGSSGLHILKQIRAENRQVEVIIISAAKDSLQIREAFRLGCLDYIIKPFSYERLNDALKKYLQKMQLLQKNFLEQKEVDLLASHQPAEEEETSPKGIDKSTLSLVCSCILAVEGWFGVQEISEEAHISRYPQKNIWIFFADRNCCSKPMFMATRAVRLTCTGLRQRERLLCTGKSRIDFHLV